MLTTPAFRVPSSLTALGLAFLIGGCADPHPATEDLAESISETAATSSSTTALAPQTCTPGEARECKKFWYDSSGQTHCSMHNQICRADGYAWQPCGNVDGGSTPDAGADVDAGED